VVAGVFMLAVPGNFPFQGLDDARPKRNIRAIDFAGAFFMLLALALTITGLEEAATLLYWVSPVVLGPLCSSAVAWGAFFVSQWYASRETVITQPIFPWFFLKDRVIMGLIL
jgi:hypothetical protein